jgi:hypothetical protein
MFSLKARAELYAKKFPQYPDSHLYVGKDGKRLYGMWFGGQNYRNKTVYHGAYPPGYLGRVTALFPECDPVLHLFSGSLPPGDYIRFDLLEHLDAEMYGDAHKLSDYFDENTFEVIYADPPYTDEDASKYGTPAVNRNVVVKECAKVLKPGGFLVWLDQVLPMYRKDTFSMVGSIGFVRSTNHRFRVITIFQKI